MPVIPALGRLRQKDCYEFKHRWATAGDTFTKIYTEKEGRNEEGREGKRENNP